MTTPTENILISTSFCQLHLETGINTIAAKRTIRHLTQKGCPYATTYGGSHKHVQHEIFTTKRSFKGRGYAWNYVYHLGNNIPQKPWLVDPRDSLKREDDVPCNLHEEMKPILETKEVKKSVPLKEFLETL
jgi:hypothetical protein